MEYSEEKVKVLSNPTVSFWLKNAIEALDKRDPVDSLVDVECLKGLMNLRWREITRDVRLN